MGSPRTEVQSQVQALVQQVFDNAYLAAMKPTIGVAVAVLLLGALSCLLVPANRSAARPAEADVRTADVARIA
jgi:hypothetical protein